MKIISRGILSAIFLTLTFALVAVAYFLPDPLFVYYTQFSRQALSAIGAITGIFPFALWEFAAVLAILWALYTLVRVLKRHIGLVSWLMGVLLAVSAAAFFFVAVYGLNYFAPPLADAMGLSVTPYSAQQLEAATQYYADEASRLADSVRRDADGRVVFDEFSQLSKKADDGYTKLAGTYPVFSARLSRPKPLMSGKLFSYFGTTGIFIPFTAESCVNTTSFGASIPYIMCHELAHRQAVGPENEANFCAFLACASNESVQFQYSGYYSAFVYCYNALFRADQAAADRVWDSISQNLADDCRAANDHYEAYEGKVQDMAQKVNDTYLKTFSQELGVQSYGEVADLLIAWYLEKL